MTEDSKNILEQVLGELNSKKEDKKKKELFKLTSNKPCPNCLSLVKHYSSALYCKECKFWIHAGCADRHFVDGKCQQISGVPAEGSRFNMPRENEDLVQLTTLHKRQHIERNLDFSSVYRAPQLQPSAKKPEKPPKESKAAKAADGEEKARSRARRGRERTRSPSPGRPLLSPLLSASRSPSPDSSSLKFQQSNKLINKVRGGAPIAFGSSNVAGTCFFDVCLVCGGSGTLYKDLVGCSDCGECFHLACIRYGGRCPQPGVTWRCSRCSVCQKCGRYTLVGDDGVECSVCSKYYHLGCVALAKEQHPPGSFWECDRCKTDRYLESLKSKVLGNSGSLSLSATSADEGEEDVLPPAVEPLEERVPSPIVPDARRCSVCDGADNDGLPGNHLLPFGCNGWVHALCALLTSGTFVMCGRLYELQEAVDRWAGRACSACGKRGKGVTVVCAHKGCERAFHPLCAAGLKGGRLYTSKNPLLYRKEVYLFYCDEHPDEMFPDSDAKSIRNEQCGETLPDSAKMTEPPLAKRPRLGEYVETGTYSRITFESLLEEAPPKIVWSAHRTARTSYTRLGALSIVSPGIRHGKIPFEALEGNKSREELLLRIGWRSYRMLWDFRAPEERCLYCCEVVPQKSVAKNSRGLISGGVAKVTVIRPPDSELGNEAFSSDSASKLWEHFIETLNGNRSASGYGRIPFRGGDFYFGFTSILMNSFNNEEEGISSTLSFETPLDLYHGVLRKQRLYRGDEKVVSCEGSSRAGGRRVWQETKKAKCLALRDLYITRDERSEEIQALLSSYSIGGSSSGAGTSGGSSGGSSSGSSGGGNSAPTAISSATFAAISGSPALSALIGRSSNFLAGTDTHGSGGGGNGGGNAGSAGNDSPRRGLIHHDPYELPMMLRYRQLLQTEDDFVPMKSPIQGLGMFALKLCTPESMLLEYRGEIIRLSVGDIREERYRKRGLADYLFSFSGKQIIDATMCGANARFVNHCHAPNCRARIIQFSGVKHIVIVSKKFISPGEELCYDYNFPIEDENSKIPCNCAAPNCPGVMN